MSSGDVNKYVEDVLTDSVLKPDRKAFYYSEVNMTDFDNGSCCSTTAQNSSELSLETTNSTSKVTTSAAIVSEDEFDGNVYDTLEKSTEIGYNKNEFNLPSNLDENMYDFEQNNLNVTNNLSKGSRLNFNKNTRNTNRTKSRNVLDSSTTLDKTVSQEEQEYLSTDLSRNMDYDLELKEDKFNLSDDDNNDEEDVSNNTFGVGSNSSYGTTNTGSSSYNNKELKDNKQFEKLDKENRLVSTDNNTNDSSECDKPNTRKIVGDVYFFLLQMKLLNTLDLVRSVCKPWGVPPFGNDYVFHFDQIVNSTVLSLLQRYEEIFTPIYSKFSSGNPKLLWTKVDDVDYFKIVYQLECLRFKQPFVSTIYDNILRYTVTKLDDSDNTNLLESLHGNYLDNSCKRNKICSYCGNLYRGQQCKYCVDSLENTPTRKTIINQVNFEEDNQSVTSTVDTKDAQDRTKLNGYDLNEELDNNSNSGRDDSNTMGNNKENKEEKDDNSSLYKDLDVSKESEQVYLYDPLLDNNDSEDKVDKVDKEKSKKEKKDDYEYKNKNKESIDNKFEKLDKDNKKLLLKELDYDNSEGLLDEQDQEDSTEFEVDEEEYIMNRLMDDSKTNGYRSLKVDLEHRNKTNKFNEVEVDEWPGDLKQVDNDSPFTLTSFMNVLNEDDFYSLFNEDISSSLVCSPESTTLDKTNKYNEDVSNVNTTFGVGNSGGNKDKDNESGNKVDNVVGSSSNKESMVDTFSDSVDLEKMSDMREGIMEEFDLTTITSNVTTTSSNNNTRLISTDNNTNDSSEVDVTTNSNVDFSENFIDTIRDVSNNTFGVGSNTSFGTNTGSSSYNSNKDKADKQFEKLDKDNTMVSSLEKSKLNESLVDQDSTYAILDENILSTINEELLNISDEDILEEQYLNKGNQDIEKIILSVLNRKLTAHFNKFQDNKYSDYVENADYLMSVYGNNGYNNYKDNNNNQLVSNKYNHPKFNTSKYKNNYLNNYMEDAYRNIDKYAYIENKYAHMENRYNYIEYPNNPTGSREKKRVKANRDPDYQYPYSSYKDLYKDSYKSYSIKDKPRSDKSKDKEEKKRKRRLNSDSISSNISNQSDSYGNGFGSYKDRDKEIKISSHVVSASVSYDKRQQRFMAQWKTKEGTKHSKSFYAKRYATPIMARKHAELYKMYILQHRVMNSNELVEPTYEQLLANNFKDLDSVNVGELDYEL